MHDKRTWQSDSQACSRTKTMPASMEKQEHHLSMRVAQLQTFISQQLMLTFWCSALSVHPALTAAAR